MGTKKPRRRKLTARDYVGGFACMFFAFGIITFLMGSSVPWGYQQVGGLVAAVIGIILMAVRLRLPRK
ncbi:MAG TPA: hypothetical protein VHR66_00340 [Gemmataceae bacterium]|jgi:hypothetical protein|nr:hypothetical protein [Gemmataceae bacterium]